MDAALTFPELICAWLGNRKSNYLPSSDFDPLSCISCGSLREGDAPVLRVNPMKRRSFVRLKPEAGDPPFVLPVTPGQAAGSRLVKAIANALLNFLSGMFLEQLGSTDQGLALRGQARAYLAQSLARHVTPECRLVKSCLHLLESECDKPFPAGGGPSCPGERSAKASNSSTSTKSNRCQAGTRRTLPKLAPRARRRSNARSKNKSPTSLSSPAAVAAQDAGVPSPTEPRQPQGPFTDREKAALRVADARSAKLTRAKCSQHTYVMATHQGALSSADRVSLQAGSLPGLVKQHHKRGAGALATRGGFARAIPATRGKIMAKTYYCAGHETPTSSSSGQSVSRELPQEVVPPLQAPGWQHVDALAVYWIWKEDHRLDLEGNIERHINYVRGEQQTSPAGPYLLLRVRFSVRLYSQCCCVCLNLPVKVTDGKQQCALITSIDGMEGSSAAPAGQRIVHVDLDYLRGQLRHAASVAAQFAIWDFQRVAMGLPPTKSSGQMMVRPRQLGADLQAVHRQPHQHMLPPWLPSMPPAPPLVAQTLQEQVRTGAVPPFQRQDGGYNAMFAGRSFAAPVTAPGWGLPGARSVVRDGMARGCGQSSHTMGAFAAGHHASQGTVGSWRPQVSWRPAEYAGRTYVSGRGASSTSGKALSTPKESSNPVGVRSKLQAKGTLHRAHGRQVQAVEAGNQEARPTIRPEVLSRRLMEIREAAIRTRQALRHPVHKASVLASGNMGQIRLGRGRQSVGKDPISAARPKDPAAGAGLLLALADAAAQCDPTVATGATSIASQGEGPFPLAVRSDELGFVAAISQSSSATFGGVSVHSPAPDSSSSHHPGSSTGAHEPNNWIEVGEAGSSASYVAGGSAVSVERPPPSSESLLGRKRARPALLSDSVVAQWRSANGKPRVLPEDALQPASQPLPDAVAASVAACGPGVGTSTDETNSHSFTALVQTQCAVVSADGAIAGGPALKPNGPKEADAGPSTKRQRTDTHHAVL